MQTLPEAARLTVDLDALAANHAACVREARGAEVAPVVKADAYGLGLGPVARRLWAEGARSFFVARVAEGADLRAALGGERPATVYVLDGCTAGAAATMAALDLVPVLNSLPQVEAWGAVARAQGERRPAALHVDTGLNRLGLRLEEARALVAAPDRLAGLDLGLVMSHLACAEMSDHPLTARQIALFEQARALFPEARASLDNSAGLFGGAPALNMARPGIALYGGGPCGRPDPQLSSVATLTAPVLQVRGVPAGESVGYGAAFTATRSMRVAIVAAGYGDGLLRAAAPRGYGWAGGARRPLLGRISMDLIALDVTDGEPVRPGDLVELLGPHVPLDDLAEAAGTIAYELLTRIGSRVSRAYVGAAG